MNALWKFIGGMLLWVGLFQVVVADDGSNPYLVIVDKNAFRLNPPAPAAEPEKAPPPSLPLIHLAGFIQTGNEIKVLLAVKVQNLDKRAAAQESAETYVSLEEGEKKPIGPDGQGVTVELIKIHASEEKVEIINAGTPMTLTLQKDGFQIAATPAAGGQIAAMPPSPSPTDPEEVKQRVARSMSRNVSGAPPRAPRGASVPASR